MMEFKDLSALDPRLAGRIQDLLVTGRIPGAVIAIVRGNENYLMTYGVKRHGAADPIGPDTAFDVGSCSKSYVATAIAMLADQGRLKLDDPVRRYVPEFELDDPALSDAVLVRDLLCNRMGLVRQRPIEAFADTSIDIFEILRRMKHLRRAYPFRTGYIYFNLGFMIAALVVERVSGLSYALFLEQQLFSALGMSKSTSGYRALELLADRAIGHVFHEGRIRVVPEQIFENTQGAGGVYSTGRDALRWLRFHLNEGRVEGRTVIAPGLVHELHRPHTIMQPSDCSLMDRAPEARLVDYCLGWRASEFHGRKILQHSGGMFGWKAQTCFVPGEDLGVAAYFNIPKQYHHAVSYLVLEHQFGVPVRDWRAIAEDDRRIAAEQTIAAMEGAFPLNEAREPMLALAAYEGDYHHPAAGRITVLREMDGLLIRIHDGPLWNMSLKPLSGHVFQADLVNPDVRDYQAAPGRMRFVVEGGRAIALDDIGMRFNRQDS